VVFGLDGCSGGDVVINVVFSDGCSDYMGNVVWDCVDILDGLRNGLPCVAVIRRFGNWEMILRLMRWFVGWIILGCVLMMFDFVF